MRSLSTIMVLIAIGAIANCTPITTPLDNIMVAPDLLSRNADAALITHKDGVEYAAKQLTEDSHLAGTDDATRQHHEQHGKKLDARHEKGEAERENHENEGVHHSGSKDADDDSGRHGGEGRGHDHTKRTEAESHGKDGTDHKNNEEKDHQGQSETEHHQGQGDTGHRQGQGETEHRHRGGKGQ